MPETHDLITSLDALEQRRAADPYVALLWSALSELTELRQRSVSQEGLNARLLQHMDEEKLFQQQLLHDMTKAFPNGDPAYHLALHEEQIARSKLCKAFFEHLLDRLGQGTVFGLLGVLGALILYWWNGQITGPK